MSKKSLILLIEDDLIGHREVYLYEIAKALSVKFKIIILAPESKIFQNELHDSIRYYPSFFKTIKEYKNYRTHKVYRKFKQKRLDTKEQLVKSELVLTIFLKIKMKMISAMMLLIKSTLNINNFYYRYINLYNKMGYIRKRLMRFKKNGINIDHVFFPNLKMIDFQINSLLSHIIYDYFLSIPWSGLLIEASLIRSEPDLNLNFISKSNRCKYFFSLDPYILDELSLRTNKKVFHLPDFINKEILNEKSDLIEEIDFFANGRKILLIIGALSYRKNILNAIEALRQYKTEFCLVIIGKVYPGAISDSELRKITQLVAELKRDVLFRDCFIPDEKTYNAIIHRADLIHLIYKSFTMSSNLITKASYFHKPIIASNKYFIGEVTNKYKLGPTVDEDSTEQLGEILTYLSNLENYHTIINNALFDEYYEKNSLEKMNRVVLETFSF